MELVADGGSYGNFNHIVVLFNATSTTQTFTQPSIAGLGFHLHPVQRASSGPVLAGATFNNKTGTATVPALTTAVFVTQQ